MNYSIDDIARYGEGAMEDRQRAAFENELAGNAALRLQLEKYLDIRAGLRMQLEKDPQEHALRETLEGMRDEYFNHNKARVVSLRQRLIRILPAAAAVILVILIWMPWRETLYQKYSGIEMQGIAERDGRADSLKLAAEQAFNKKHFAQARAMLYTIHRQEPNNAMYTFFYGVSLIEVDSLMRARAILQEVYEGKSVFKNQALYFTAMTWLKEKDHDQTRKWLRKIPSDAGNYEKAQELLRRLD